jgi:hypothetical protein
MRVLLGGVPEIPDFDPEAAGLHKIGGPSAAISQLLASLVGLFLLVVPIAGLCLILSTIAIRNPDIDPNYIPPVAWGMVILGIFTYVPLHELLHLMWHPRFGTSDQSILLVWPTKLLFGVYYEGCMSRTRWLIMRLAPFAFLSVLPAVFIAIFQYVAFSHMSKTYIEVLMVLNTVGSGADVAAVYLVASQVPHSARLCFRGGKAYWQETTAVSRAGSAATPD